VDSNTSSPHDQKLSARILTIQNGETRPLYGTDPVGTLAPSSTFLVERFDLENMVWQTHLATDHLLMLCLKPAITWASERDKTLNQITLSAGQVGFNSRWVPTSVRSHGPTSQLWVRVADSTLMGVTHNSTKNGRLEFLPTPVIVDDRLTNLLYALESERKRGYPAGSLYIDGIELALATMLVHSYSVFPQKSPRTHGGLGSLRIRQTVEFMYANLDRPPTLRALAKCARLCPSQFSAQFRASTGVTPTRYMLRLRIERAKQLLRSSRLSVLEIGMTVGFDNQQHFATVFRRLAGISPSVYRRHV
jgi:AraC family transcriptional regulator